jgi:hypothetical protein
MRGDGSPRLRRGADSGGAHPPREANRHGFGAASANRGASRPGSGVGGRFPGHAGRLRAQRSPRSIRIPARLETLPPRSTPRGRSRSLTIDAVPGGRLRARPSGFPPRLPPAVRGWVVAVCPKGREGAWARQVPHLTRMFSLLARPASLQGSAISCRCGTELSDKPRRRPSPTRQT